MLQGWAVPQSMGGRWQNRGICAGVEKLSPGAEMKGWAGEQGSLEGSRVGQSREKGWKCWQCCSAEELCRARGGNAGREPQGMMQCRARKRESCAADPRAQVGFGERARTVWMLKGGSTTALAILLPHQAQQEGDNVLSGNLKNLFHKLVFFFIIFFNNWSFFKLFFPFPARVKSDLTRDSCVIK